MMNLLRILTPEEINELTTTSEGNKRVPLTQLMYVKMGVETSEEVEAASLAKILPFTFPEEEKDEELETISEESAPFEEHSDTTDQNTVDDSKKENEPDERLQTSSFILIEKKRLEKNVHKMRQKEIMQSYKKNASIDIEQERGLRDDMKKSSRSGVLINKKHA